MFEDKIRSRSPNIVDPFMHNQSTLVCPILTVMSEDTSFPQSCAFSRNSEEYPNLLDSKHRLNGL